MKDYTYFFELKDLLTQFVAAFDDTTIKRYNKNVSNNCQKCIVTILNRPIGLNKI